MGLPYPYPKDGYQCHPPHAIGAPEIRPATKVEIEIARQIKDNHPIRLTA